MKQCNISASKLDSNEIFQTAIQNPHFHQVVGCTTKPCSVSLTSSVFTSYKSARLRTTQTKTLITIKVATHKSKKCYMYLIYYYSLSYAQLMQRLATTLHGF